MAESGNTYTCLNLSRVVPGSVYLLGFLGFHVSQSCVDQSLPTGVPRFERATGDVYYVTGLRSRNPNNVIKDIIDSHVKL